MGKNPRKNAEELAEEPKLEGLPDVDPAIEDPSAIEQPTRDDEPLTWIQALQKDNDQAFKTALSTKLKEIIGSYKDLKNYEVLFLFDTDSIGTYHSDRLYSAARSLKGKKKDILLIVDSPGGRIEPAYLISKTLKRIAAERFSVAVPRSAKSAATLISLGADEIHMGMISQLGPIDPQVHGLPALALGNALNHIADIAEKRPSVSEMLTKYLIDQAPIRILGYYERVSESASQYAERLLRGKNLPEGKTAAGVAQHLVQHYKDHSFVIDVDEALGLLGPTLIKEQTPEYNLSDDIYSLLNLVQFVAGMNKKKFWIVGDLPDGLTIVNAKT